MNSPLNLGFFFALIFLFFVNNIFEKLVNYKLNNLTYIILPSFLFALLFLQLVESFLTFFFFIELYSVLYYFFFLTSYNFSNQTILKYKNGLLLLLWNNFLTTFFLALGCILIIRSCGTTTFNDLNFISLDTYSIFFFMIGVF